MRQFGTGHDPRQTTPDEVTVRYQPLPSDDHSWEALHRSGTKGVDPKRLPLVLHPLRSRYITCIICLHRSAASATCAAPSRLLTRSGYSCNRGFGIRVFCLRQLVLHLRLRRGDWHLSMHDSFQGNRRSGLGKQWSSPSFHNSVHGGGPFSCTPGLGCDPPPGL